MIPNQCFGSHKDEKINQSLDKKLVDHNKRNQDSVAPPPPPPPPSSPLPAPDSLNQDSQYQRQLPEIQQSLDYVRARRRILSAQPSPSRHWRNYMNEILEAKRLRQIRLMKNGEENIDDFLRRFPIE